MQASSAEKVYAETAGRYGLQVEAGESDAKTDFVGVPANSQRWFTAVAYPNLSVPISCVSDQAYFTFARAPD